MASQSQPVLASNGQTSAETSAASEIIWVDGSPSFAACAVCGVVDELRLGVCFDCACEGERRAAHRSVAEHFARGVWGVLRLRFDFNTRIDFMWGWERLTRTGDYAPGGEFDRQYFNPRKSDVVLTGPEPQ